DRHSPEFHHKTSPAKLSDRETIQAADAESTTPRSAKETLLRMKLLGSNPDPRTAAADPLPGRVSYFIGNDPTKWRTNVPTFGRVNYKEVYPGIDLTYYGTQGSLEYDFVVAPGADPET